MSCFCRDKECAQTHHRTVFSGPTYRTLQSGRGLAQRSSMTEVGLGRSNYIQRHGIYQMESHLGPKVAIKADLFPSGVDVRVSYSPFLYACLAQVHGAALWSAVHPMALKRAVAAARPPWWALTQCTLALLPGRRSRTPRSLLNVVCCMRRDAAERLTWRTAARR
jgi:hypothetical protein